MTNTHDILIIGGGLVGLSLANLLAKHNISVAVVDTQDLALAASASSDGRASAIAYDSYRILERADIWNHIASDAGPILDIRITDDASPIFIHYDHTMVGDAPMGYMVENHIMRKALYNGATQHPNITLLAPHRYRSIARNAHHVTVTLDNGETHQAALLVAADGKRSAIRKMAGIKVNTLPYHQVGIVCNVAHEKHHEHIAQERFLPTGPFAILPLKEGYHSSIVWTEKEMLAPTFQAMSDDDFTAEIQERFGDYLGTVHLDSKRFFYPLTLTFATRYVDTRLALIGDAAHGIHPIAGQGFNLGLRDVDAIAQRLIEHKSLGLDLGSAVLLDQYQQSRRLDNALMIGITDALNRLFSNRLLPLQLARRTGMAVVEKLLPVKRFFIKHAMGD